MASLIINILTVKVPWTHFVISEMMLNALILISITECHDTYQKAELRPVVNKVPIGIYRVGLR